MTIAYKTSGKFGVCLGDLLEREGLLARLHEARRFRFCFSLVFIAVDDISQVIEAAMARAIEESAGAWDIKAGVCDRVELSGSREDLAPFRRV